MARGTSERKRRQKNISLEKRKRLIEEVQRKNQSINSSAKKIGIKYSTAKLIVKRFRETGTIMVRNIKNTPSFPLSRPSQRPETPSSSSQQIENQEQEEQQSGSREVLPSEPPLQRSNGQTYPFLEQQEHLGLGTGVHPWQGPQFFMYNIFWQ